MTMARSVCLAALPVMSSTSVCRYSFLRSTFVRTLLAVSFRAQRVTQLRVPYSGSPSSAESLHQYLLPQTNATQTESFIVCTRLHKRPTPQH